MSLASITLSGTIKNNAEQRTTPNGNLVTNFMMMTLRYDGKAKEEKSYPVKVTIWGDSADMLTDLVQGARVVVTGRLQIDQYNDKNGKMVRLVAIEANRVQFLPQLAQASMQMNASSSFTDSTDSYSGSETDANSEEVPF